MGFYKLLVLSVILNVTANILLKKGVVIAGGISGDRVSLIADLIKVAFSPYIIGGLILYCFSFIIWLRVLSFNDFSRAYPIFATFVFLLTTLGSIKFLNEDVSIMRFTGMVIMLIGIYVVART